MIRHAACELIDPAAGRWQRHGAANIERVQRYYDECGTAAIRRLAELVSPSQGHDPAAGDFDSNSWRSSCALPSCIPRLRDRSEWMAAQDDTVALRFRSEGTFRNEFMGLPPTVAALQQRTRDVPLAPAGYRDLGRVGPPTISARARCVAGAGSIAERDD